MRLRSIKTEPYQKKFFDEHPGLYPWPDLLVEMGFSKSYKLRDVKFKKYLDLLGMEKGEKVLDVGCGTGVFLARLAKTYGVDCIGVDVSEKSIAIAKQWKFSRLDFRVADAVQLPFADRSFDYVLSFDALEHIRDPRPRRGRAEGGHGKALSEMVRVLKPGGSLLIYTINKDQRYTWNFWLDKMGIDVYQRVAHDPKLFLDPDQLKKKLEGMGIRVEQLELFNSFFTLIVDELIMILILCLRKLNFFNSSSRLKTAAGRIFINLADFFSRLLLPPLELLEAPWKKFGCSNSFFILGKKR